jgi:hypothetical protein
MHHFLQNSHPIVNNSANIPCLATVDFGFVEFDLAMLNDSSSPSIFSFYFLNLELGVSKDGMGWMDPCLVWRFASKAVPTEQSATYEPSHPSYNTGDTSEYIIPQLQHV